MAHAGGYRVASASPDPQDLPAGRPEGDPAHAQAPGARWRWLATLGAALVAVAILIVRGAGGQFALRNEGHSHTNFAAFYEEHSPEVVKAFKERAKERLLVSPPTRSAGLGQTLQGKPAVPTIIPPTLPPTPGGECLGFDKCPAYPRPYGFGTWPKKYLDQGEFPKGFIWGLGTASYQIEGAYDEDGRGASIWDTFTGADTTKIPGGDCSYCCKAAPCPINSKQADKGATGNIADDHYHMWQSDVAFMKSMGLKNYRFSIAWPRLVPTGKVADGVNEKAKTFYNGLIDALLAAGITPYVTLYHWDLPQALLSPPEVNGWWSRDAEGKPDGQIQQDFVDYADVVFKEFGDRVKTWITFNEAWTFTFLASGFGKAPSIEQFSNMSIDPWIAGHNVLNAHAAVVDLYRRKYQTTQKGAIGITNNCDWREPRSSDPQDIAAAERTVEFQLGWFSDPIFGEEGDYPPAMRKLYGDRLPKFTPEQAKLIKGSADFYGLNHYGTGWAEFAPDEPGADTTYAKVSEEGFPKAQSAWLYGSGWGFRKILNWVDQRYNHPPIFVTEGGWSLEAHTASQGLADQPREMYYANYTAAMLQAIKEDGVDVRGYFAWSLMDNFEWERGYVERFGVNYNDYDFGMDPKAPTNQAKQPTAGNQVRSRKTSSCWLEAVWRKNMLVDPQSSNFHGCATSAVFNASYEEKGNPTCKRRIILSNATSGAVSGTNAAGNTCNGPSDESWGPLPVKLVGGTIIADLSSEGGTKNLQGYWNSVSSTIEWGDGSVWQSQQQ